MTEWITEEDIQWLMHQVNMQTSETYHKLAEMDLKIAKAVKELQKNE